MPLAGLDLTTVHNLRRRSQEAGQIGVSVSPLENLRRLETVGFFGQPPEAVRVVNHMSMLVEVDLRV